MDSMKLDLSLYSQDTSMLWKKPTRAVLTAMLQATGCGTGQRAVDGKQKQSALTHHPNLNGTYITRNVHLIRVYIRGICTRLRAPRSKPAMLKGGCGRLL